MSNERIAKAVRQMQVQAGHLSEKVDDLKDYYASKEAARQEQRTRVREYVETQGSDEARALINQLGEGK
jgi:hypothetical protein